VRERLLVPGCPDCEKKSQCVMLKFALRRLDGLERSIDEGIESRTHATRDMQACHCPGGRKEQGMQRPEEEELKALRIEEGGEKIEQSKKKGKREKREKGTSDETHEADHSSSAS